MELENSRNENISHTRRRKLTKYHWHNWNAPNVTDTVTSSSEGHKTQLESATIVIYNCELKNRSLRRNVRENLIDPSLKA